MSGQELIFRLEGTYHCSVILKLYRALPRLEFTLRMAKTLSEDIESVYLPLVFEASGYPALYSQRRRSYAVPALISCRVQNMEYYIADEGILYQGEQESVLINTQDTPLIYMGQLEHHPIVLCDSRQENNGRPVYSWDDE